MPKQSLIKQYKKVAKEYLEKEKIKDCIFSKKTYQILVEDRSTNEDFWVFLQLDLQNRIHDTICSCKQFEQKDECEHIAAAYLWVFQDPKHPIHEKFENNLWNKLCFCFFKKIGDDQNVLIKKRKGKYLYQDLFSIESKDPYLKEILEERYEETEDTSIKFSGLSEEEIENWKKGIPSESLRYELSFWSDIAKWLFIKQMLLNPYTVSFDYDKKEVPKAITVSFDNISVFFSLSYEILETIIPSLNTVQSPLKVHKLSRLSIKELIYIPERFCFKNIFYEKKKSQKDIEGININGWIFIPKDGFYPSSTHHLFDQEEIGEDKIEDLLNHYSEFIQKKLSNAKLHLEPKDVFYSLSFDKKWNLHILSYLFEPNDMQKKYSKCFGNWAYIEGKGFFHLGSVIFSPPKVTIQCENVSDFVTDHKIWLNMQKGFSTHIAKLESLITYEVTKNHRLIFHSHASIAKSYKKRKDFGKWVYIEGEGFYLKQKHAIKLPYPLDEPIHPDKIPHLIHHYEDDLSLIKGFFAKETPIAKSFLEITLNDKEQITINPKYTLLSKYKKKDVFLVDDITYVPGEGFSRIPNQLLLPSKYRHETVIKKNELFEFLETELEKLLPIASKIDPQILEPEKILLKVQSATPESEGIKFVSFYETNIGRVSLSQVWEAINQKKKIFFSPAGRLDLSLTRFLWLKKLKKEQVHQDFIFLSTLELIRLDAWEEIHLPEKGNQTKNLILSLRELKPVYKPDLKGLTSSLRPYQLAGVHWLWFLYQHNLSGLLSDDMGLGKTHQAMGLIAAIKNQKQDAKFLIICPTSVIYHWLEKLKEFLPDVDVFTYHGVKRSLENFTENHNILLTSYGIWRKDFKKLANLSFELAIFDEVQLAKSHQSKLHLTLLQTKAKMRLGLTGTPIENHLRELKSLFDLLLPNYMPSDKVYREYFVRPIEKWKDQERKRFLSRFIHPFVLRRKKENVLRDLPKKTEEIAHCGLSKDQYYLYQKVRQNAVDILTPALEKDEEPIPYLHIFAILTKLKQICDHPSVFYGKPENYEKYQSGKWNLFKELLFEARESKQKVVIFTQYLAMLDIFELFLKKNHIQYASIRGSTTDRAKQIHKFHQDPACEIFLASLQASGLGIDLTPASVVIHYDRWWNAAKENQATDRVHRFGQTRGVQVFKLVTKGTFEERIDQLIEKKKSLMNDVIGIDANQVIKKLNRHELLQLFEAIDGVVEED